MPLLQVSKDDTKRYVELLQVVWSLSNLFSDNTIPYLYYRIAENIFCKAFSADNLSRSDCTADASLNKIWYGLKTFHHKKWKTLEKVAEFNKERKLYAEYENKPDKFIEIIAELRNRRIESTMSIHWIKDMRYHCVTRDDWKFYIHEEKMDMINIDWIKNINQKKNSITFNDGLHEYSFNLSKSTLFKRFFINPIETFDVKMFEDPLELLEKIFNDYSHLFEETEKIFDEIIYLPLYSEKWDIHVPEKSGLNQRNAEGRKRDPDEIYVPIPARIHKIFPDFFPEKDVSFNLYLPDWEVLSAKLCQENRKALMTNPNKALWKRLLRDVLKKEERELVTYEDLEKMWVDSVEIAKKWDEYYINFKEIWKFEDFKNENEIK